jgi:hypothetical protein
MSTKNKKNAALEPSPAQDTPPAQPVPEYITARLLGHEINKQFLTLSVPDGVGGFSRVRMRVPLRLAHCFKKNAVVRVRRTDDPLVVEPFPSIL